MSNYFSQWQKRDQIKSKNLCFIYSPISMVITRMLWVLLTFLLCPHSTVWWQNHNQMWLNSNHTGYTPCHQAILLTYLKMTTSLGQIYTPACEVPPLCPSKMIFSAPTWMIYYSWNNWLVLFTLAIVDLICV